MSTYFVSRHPGAVDWAASQGFSAARVISHLDPAVVCPGDTVLGTLPVHLAAQVCERGGRYYNLSLDLPQAWRGRELSAEELLACRARLERYEVRAVDDDGSTPLRER